MSTATITEPGQRTPARQSASSSCSASPLGALTSRRTRVRPRSRAKGAGAGPNTSAPARVTSGAARPSAFPTSQTLASSVPETLTADLPPQVEKAVERILLKACDADLRLATAESCTGGLLASLLTDVDGCSHAFERAFIVYTDEAKREMLGVDAALLERHGAVSEPVARAMAEGALERSHADVAIAVTGFAGPTRRGEEGLVHFACARRGGPTAHREERFGPLGRGGVRLACLETATEMLEAEVG